jgi:hypothetical protein
MDYSRVLAEKHRGPDYCAEVPERDRETKDGLDDLTDNYEYDTCPEQAFKSQKRNSTAIVAADLALMTTRNMNAKQKRQLHQLPPILQVTMIAIDEESGAKLADNFRTASRLVYRSLCETFNIYPVH